MRKDIIYEGLLPLVFLAVLTLIFWVSQADFIVLKTFYRESGGWFLGDRLPWILLYKYGSLPGLFIGAASLLVLVTGFFVKRYSGCRKAALFLILCLALGPGLIINTLLKDHWGRPRPLHIQEFGGSEEYRRAWVRTDFKDGRSFPSGHASIGFFLMTPFFVLRQKRGKLALGFLLAGLIYGSLMGLGRMIQGSHFPSDVLWAAGLVYFTGFLLACLFSFYRISQAEAG